MYKSMMRAYGKYLIMICAVGFITFGVVRQEHKEVLQKAINVCLECIGVG